MKTKFNLLLIPCLVLSTLAGFAQQPQGTEETKEPPTKVQRLNRAPVNKEILKVKLPHPKEIRLANGLTVLVLENHRLPTISYDLWIESGALSDPKDVPGLASFAADMLREGTSTRKSTDIASALDELGATFNANAQFGSNLTTIQASGLSDSAEKLMDLMSDMVQNPSFSGEELGRFLRQQRARLFQTRSNPAFLARERFAQAVYGSFPAAVQSPTLDSLRKTTPEALKDFHDKYYAPNNAILGISGDITVEQAAALAKKYFGPWKSHPVPAVSLGTVTGPSAARVFLVDRPGSVQSNILAGGLSLRRADPDYIPLTVANRILGGGGAARLFANLREEHGYTYGAYSRVSSDLFPGTIVANTEVRNAVTDGSLHELLYELNRIREQKVPATELEEAKGSIVAAFALSLERPNAIMNSWLAVKYYGLPDNYWDHYSDQIAKVDANAVQRVARKYIDLAHLQVVVVGDASQVRAAVAKYGNPEMYDADGKPVETKPAAPTGSGNR